jgi:hypothetical protein
MLLLKWIFKMLRDISFMAWHNRAWGVALFLFFLLGIALIIVASQAAAPFIYTIF